MVKKKTKSGESELEELAQKIVSGLGYVVEDTRTLDEDTVAVTAKPVTPLGGGMPSIIRFNLSTVSLEDVQSLYDDVLAYKVGGGAYISLGGFSEEARKYAEANELTLLNKSSISDLLTREGLASESGLTELLEKYDIIEEPVCMEKAFKTAKSYSEMKRYFKNQGRRKRLGLFGVDEIPVKIRKHYFPIGVFRIKMKKGTHTRDQFLTEDEVKEYVHVSLNSGNLYYISKSKRGAKSVIASSQVFNDIRDLPPGARDSLFNLLENGELPEKNFDRKDLATLERKGLVKVSGSSAKSGGMFSSVGLMLSEITDIFVIAVDEILGGLTGAKMSAKSRESKPEETIVRPKVVMPRKKGGGYNLEDHIEVTDEIDCEANVEEANVEPSEVADVLGKVFNLPVKYKGVTLMPYYTCSFIDKETKAVLRHQKVWTPKFR